MLACPNCQTRLAKQPSPEGPRWLCGACGGRAIHLPTLRCTPAGAFVRRLWALARSVPATDRKRPCPMCDKLMATVPTLAVSGSTDLKYLICILGYPVEVEPPPLHGRPWATWTLIGLVTAVSVYALLFWPEAPLEWGVVPAELWRHGGLTLLTSFFLHGSPFHLIGNMYFLAVFGDNVEDLLGGGRYLGLLLMATVTGDLLHAAVRPLSLVPAIGASGGIAGVIVYYGLTFPRGRLRLLRFFRFVDLSVWGALVLWVSMQLIGTIVEATRGPHVAYAAHVGGAFTGLIFWSLSRRREPARVLCMASAGRR